MWAKPDRSEREQEKPISHDPVCHGQRMESLFLLTADKKVVTVGRKIGQQLRDRTPKPLQSAADVYFDEEVCILSIRLIAAIHGVSEGAIRKKSKRHEWTRDMADAVHLRTWAILFTTISKKLEKGACWGRQVA